MVRHVQNDTQITLKLSKREKTLLVLQVYSDASFASNFDLSSRLGYFIFLKDKFNESPPLLWTF